MKKGKIDKNLLDVKRVMEKLYGHAAMVNIFKERAYPEYSGFEEPLPDIVGYKQHAGECASDAIQEVLLFADAIREFTQPILYNVTPDQMDVRSKLALAYNDWDRFNDYFKYIQKRFRSHYDVINYLRTHKFKAEKYQSEFEEVCALNPLFYRKRAHSAEAGILALKKLKREKVYTESGLPLSEIQGIVDKIIKWLHIPFETKRRSHISLDKSVGILMHMEYGFIKPDRSLYWKTTSHETAFLKMTGKWYYYDNNEGFTHVEDELVSQIMNPALNIWVIKFHKTYIVKGGENPTHVWKHGRWDSDISAFTNIVDGSRKYKVNTYLLKPDFRFEFGFIGIQPSSDTVPYNYKNCTFEGGRAANANKAISTAQSIIECIYGNDVSNSSIFEDLYHYMYENLDYISTNPELYASLVATLDTIGTRPACTPMIHYWVFQIKAHINGLVRDKYTWFEVPPLKPIYTQVEEHETPPEQREAKRKAIEEFMKKEEMRAQGIDPDKMVERTPCPEGQVRNAVTKECREKKKPTRKNAANNNSSNKRKTPKKREKFSPCPPGMKRDPKTRKCVARLTKRTPCPPGQRRDPKTKKCRDLIKVKLHE